MIAPVEQTIVALVLAIGIFYFIKLAASTREKTWTIDKFFLAGRNLGSELSENAIWGSSFSFANGIYYFAVLGYLKGPAVFIFQIPWSLAIIVIAWLLPRFMSEAKEYTFHGFLGSVYGRRARLIATCATVCAFLGIVAFEINITLEVILRIFQRDALLIPATFIVAAFVAAYCDIGGFTGTALTDRAQNYWGVAAIVILITGILLLGIQLDFNRLPDSATIEDLAATDAWRNISLSRWVDFENVSLLFTFGILAFAPFINFVDMSNWQVLSANTALPPDEMRRLRKKICVSAILILIFPGFVGSMIGAIWRGIDLAPQELFASSIISVSRGFGSVFGDGFFSELLSGLVLGVVIFGLASMAMSTVDSYLISTALAYTSDYKYEDLIERRRTGEKVSAVEEEKLIKTARSVLYITVLIAAAAFMGIRLLIGDDSAFILQFVIASFATSMAPAFFLGLFYYRKYTPRLSQRSLNIVSYSIAVGCVASIAVFVLFTAKRVNDVDAYAWASIASFGLALVVSVFGLCVGWVSRWWAKRRA